MRYCSVIRQVEPMRKRDARKKIVSSPAWKSQEAENITHGHSEWLRFKSWPEVEELIARLNVLPGSPRYVAIRSLWNDRNGQKDET